MIETLTFFSEKNTRICVYMSLWMLGCKIQRNLCTGLNYKGNLLIQVIKKSRRIWLQVRVDQVTQQCHRGSGISSPFLFFFPQVYLHSKADSPLSLRMVFISSWNFALTHLYPAEKKSLCFSNPSKYCLILNLTGQAEVKAHHCD